MRQLCKGNVAVVKGAIAAGCRAYYGYPITPASEIAEAAALYLPEIGVGDASLIARCLAGWWVRPPDGRQRTSSRWVRPETARASERADNTLKAGWRDQLDATVSKRFRR
jgi:hypothetical protein